jgi:hypothetical protein
MIGEQPCESRCGDTHAPRACLAGHEAAAIDPFELLWGRPEGPGLEGGEPLDDQ